MTIRGIGMPSVVMRAEVSAFCDDDVCGTTGGGASVRPQGETGWETEDGCLTKAALSSGEVMPDFEVAGFRETSELRKLSPVGSEETVSGISCCAVCLTDMLSPGSL